MDVESILLFCIVFYRAGRFLDPQEPVKSHPKIVTSFSSPSKEEYISYLSINWFARRYIFYPSLL